MGNFCRNCGKALAPTEYICTNCRTNTYNMGNIQENTVETKATVGFILGLSSSAAWLLPLLGYPVTICGIVFSALGLKSIKNKSKATAGLILSIVFLVATLINSVLGVIIALS